MATAYAADGYARIKGISAVITTFGVGTMLSHAPRCDRQLIVS